ncbi:hypothetical protein HMPREF9075_02667 [Capnocytophaga sp. oral taxon 332 str. F0381]|nr:hypothetical protein HMPREF9075_02667 [Capnocytophaga sp. oral taxon 332 str. F0381]
MFIIANYFNNSGQKYNDFSKLPNNLTTFFYRIFSLQMKKIFKIEILLKYYQYSFL